MWPLDFNTLSRRRTRFAARPRTGFTVLELVVVMFIGVLVTGMSLGKLHDISNQQKVARAASTIRSSVEAAFALAARDRQPIDMTWNSSTMQFQVTNRGGSTVFRRIVLNSSAYNLPSGSVTFSSSSIEVYPDGLASGAFTVTISANGASRTISVSRAGMVQTQ